MDPRINNNTSIPQSFRPAQTGGSTPVDTSAFEAALGGPAAPAARSTSAAPSTQNLFQSMAPGLMFNPVASAAPAASSPVASARDALYQQLGIGSPSHLGATERFLSQRGLEIEGPVMSFGHAEMALVS